LPSQFQTPEVAEPLPLAIEPNPEAQPSPKIYLETNIGTKNPEKTIPSDRPETTLPLKTNSLKTNEEDFVDPGVLDYGGELEDLGVTEIPPVSEPVIAPVAPPKLALSSSEPIDFSEVIAKSNMELKRLGWSSDQGRNYLLQTYGKRSRQLLSDEELLEFLLHLESQPTPVRA
jgi:hypothetical protein